MTNAAAFPTSESSRLSRTGASAPGMDGLPAEIVKRRV